MSGATLSGANLYGANLSGANLSYADLSGAKLNNTIVPINGPIKTFQLNQFIANYYDGTLTIGCLKHDTKYWLANYQRIGKENNFTDFETEMYGLFILKMSKDKVSK